MKKSVCFSALAVVALATGAYGQTLLHDNGPIVTHPGQGFNGLDASMASIDPNVGGSNSRFFATSPDYFWVADHFTVPANQNWSLGTIVVNNYATGSSPGFPGWTGGTLRIHDWVNAANPEQGTERARVTSSTWTFTDVYRVFNGQVTNNQRPIHAVEFDLTGTQLGPGQYWLVWQMEGGSSAWANYVMDVDPNNPNNPITRSGDAMHKTTDGWIQMLITDPNYNVQPQLPFQIYDDGAAGLQIALQGSCPGQMRLDYSNAAPNSNAAILIARREGSQRIPTGNPCAGTTLGLDSSASVLTPPGTFRTSGSGNGSFTGNAVPGACGQFLQMITVTGCETSNVVQIQ